MTTAQTAPEGRDELRQWLCSWITGLVFPEITPGHMPTGKQLKLLNAMVNPIIRQIAAHDQALIQRVRESIKDMPLPDKYDLHKACDHAKDKPWGWGHNDGVFDALNAVTAVLNGLEQSNA